MSHNNHVIDGLNKDVGVVGWEAAKEYYLELASNWTPYNPDPMVIYHEGVQLIDRENIIS